MLATAQDTGSQILDATLDALAEVGLARLGLEDVAARAGVSRQTVYRWFQNRHGLISATIVREEQRLLDEVTRAAGHHHGLEDALVVALETLLTWTRDHPLLGKLLAEEADLLLPFLTSGDAPVLGIGRQALLDVLGEWLPAGADTRTAADVLARVMLSYAIDPPAEAPDVMAASLASLFVHGVAGRSVREPGGDL